MCISPISANVCFAQNKWSPTAHSETSCLGGGAVAAVLLVEALQCTSFQMNPPPLIKKDASQNPRLHTDMFHCMYEHNTPVVLSVHKHSVYAYQRTKDHSHMKLCCAATRCF